MLSKLPKLSPFAKYLILQSFFLCGALVSLIVGQYRFGHQYHNSIMPYGHAQFDDAGVFAFAMIAAHVTFLFFMTWKQRCFTTVILTTLYAASYSALSFNGNYHASRSGRFRIVFAMVDQKLWHAKCVFWQPFIDVAGDHTYQATIIGYFYSPLIVLDRSFIHPTIPFLERSDDIGTAHLPITRDNGAISFVMARAIQVPLIKRSSTHKAGLTAMELSSAIESRRMISSDVIAAWFAG